MCWRVAYYSRERQSYMGKKGGKKKKAWKYLYELSIVVAGIAITLMANNWITGSAERRDIRLYMNAVKAELTDNLKLMEQKSEYYRRAGEFSGILIRNSSNRDVLDSEVIKDYDDVARNYFFLVYKSNAFEMLKISGYMRHIKDRALLDNIWECYSMMEELKSDNDFYMTQKAEAVKNAVVRATQWPLDVRLRENNELYTFFAHYNVNLHDMFDDCAARIEATLGLFR